MGLSSQELREILRIVEEVFICLRCGECCFRWKVRFDNVVIKKQMKICDYLEPVKLENGKWIEAKCKVYQSRPKQCRDFKMAFASICPIGLWKWKRLLQEFPDSQLPDSISLIFQILFRQKKQEGDYLQDEEVKE